MENLEKEIVKKLTKENKTISFMESCTGGYLANKITNVSGSSSVLKVSLVTYSNEFKIKFGVSDKTINEYTVYSLETAKEMAKKASDFANSNYGIGITGELGNSSKEKNKVYYAIYNKLSGDLNCKTICIAPDDRNRMKEEIAESVLEELWDILMKN